MRAVRKPRHRPDGGGVPRLHRSLLPAGTGAGAPEDFSAPCPPALSEALAGQLDQSPGRLLLFSTIPEELEDRDWQETDGFRWTALEAEGDHSLLDALTAQAAALWESGAEGPAVALVYP